MLLPSSFVGGYLVRGVVLWFAIRIGAAFGASAAGFGAGSTLSLHPLAVLFLVGVVCLASVIDDRVRRDDLFLANLGVAPAAAPAVSGGAALAVEVGVQLVGRVL